MTLYRPEGSGELVVFSAVALEASLMEQAGAKHAQHQGHVFRDFPEVCAFRCAGAVVLILEVGVL